jgi:glycosyltransferase involved in cell wall biosynthesis
VPPVATLTGGVPDLITQGLDGYMEPVGDTDSQAARLISLLTDTALHDRVAAAARNTALARFCTDLIIPQYEAHYERVLSGSGSGNFPGSTGVQLSS